MVNLQMSVHSMFSKSLILSKKTLTLKLDDATLLKEENPAYLGIHRQLSIKKFIMWKKKQAKDATQSNILL